MDVSKLIDVVVTTAKAFVPGVASLENAAHSVVDLVKEIRPTLSSTDQAALDAALPGLLSKMNLDVDQAIADLRGN